jgi:UDPglucose 6-dehydrogenase
MKSKQPLIGFIGQGFIGKHMADDFENRGYAIVRYAVEEPYIVNKSRIADCDITFIAVPTPTTPDGFDFSIIRSVLPLIGKGKIAVIKSTIVPGTTEQLQEDFPDIVVMHAPEFLRETSAAEDTAHPERNIVGITVDDAKHRKLAEQVMAVLPPAPYNIITTARSAECIKYIGNSFLYTKLVFMNIMHDFVQSVGADWEAVREAVGHDSRIGHGHTHVVHKSGSDTNPGRGAGGHCFIKDFEALIQQYAATASDEIGLKALMALRHKNNQLLIDSQKDLDLLYGVYGDDIPTA